MQISIPQILEGRPAKWYIFLQSELGKLYLTIPWAELEGCIVLPAKKGKGAPSWFDAKGMFGLMFLKAWTGLSDEKLIDRLNTDYAMQLFCNMLLPEHELIRDKDIVGRVRGLIAKHADWGQVQRVLLGSWKQDIENTHLLLMDATCYESYIRFPTDVRLLWECCEWVHGQIGFICGAFKENRPRSKYKEQKVKQSAYSRMKKKAHKQTRKRIGSLLYLLEKLIGQLDGLLTLHPIGLPTKGHATLTTIRTVLGQQTSLHGDGQAKVEGRIVSLHKPYVRPIKRGKENKSAEFGMKVHMMQVDGINIIDMMSFNAFNECTRLKDCVVKHRVLFGACTQVGADNIYATNENRSFLTEEKVLTNFPQKGRKTTDEAVIGARKRVGTLRSTVMEGSFGNEKNHYGLGKIKAKSEQREKIWVFFGVMTANAVKIGRRREQKQQELKQAA